MTNTASESSEFRDSLFNPISILKACVSLCGVTSFESRIYDWLLNEYWGRFRDRYPGFAALLRYEWIGHGQMLISWTPRPADPRRTVFVAHCDREGYEIVSVRQVKECLELECRTPWRNMLNPIAKGQSVLIAGGSTRDLMHTKLQVERVVANDTLQTISVPATDVATRIFADYSFNQISLSHYIADLGVGQCRVDEVSIRALYLDNTMGVAASTAAMAAAVASQTDANISILYTTGEEAQFTGMVDVVVNLNDASIARDHILWVVVDASSVEASRSVPLLRWMQDASNVNENSQPVPFTGIAIRVEDIVSRYDVLGALALHQATAAVRRSITTNGSHLRFLKLIPSIEGADWSRGLFPVGCGIFPGGACEASVLSVAAAIRNRVGLEPRSKDLVAAIAIPLRNYRSLRNNSLYPEVAPAGVLHAAAAVLGAVPEVYGRLGYWGARRGGFCGAATFHRRLKDEAKSMAYPISSDDDLAGMYLENYKRCITNGIFSRLQASRTTRILA